MTRDHGAAFATALDFERGTLQLLAKTFAPIDGGWLILQPSLPVVWSINQVRVTRPIGYAEAIELVDEHLDELPYRQLAIEDQASGEALEEAFRAEGWRVDRNVTMVLAREPSRELDTGMVVEPSEEEALALMRRWSAEDPELKLSGDPLRQVVEFSRLQWRARRARRLGVAGEDGAAAAITALFSDGVVAQIEDVYTVPEARRRGYGRATLTRAASLALAAGHDLTFIVADDNDWPKQLYAQIGFEPVGRVWLFHRDVSKR
jgi:GNAT superfamily N-acetyltransferase